jgi:hypothetical protein
MNCFRSIKAITCLIHRKTKRLPGSEVNLLDPCRKN